jgi:hypothetical protein
MFKLLNYFSVYQTWMTHQAVSLLCPHCSSTPGTVYAQVLRIEALVRAS